MPTKLKLTPAVADAIVEAVRRGVPPGTAARAAGITDASLYAWLSAPVIGRWRNGSDMSQEAIELLSSFRERVDQASAEYEQGMIESIARAGTITGKSGVPEWRAHAWLANNHPHYRATYRPERVQVVQGDQNVAIQHKHIHTLVRELDDTSLARMLTQEPLPPPREDR